MLTVSLVRHGQPDAKGDLTDQGIETVSRTAAVLYDMAKNPRYPHMPYGACSTNDISSLPPVSLTERCQIASLRWATEYTHYEGNYATLHAPCPPSVVAASSFLRAERTGKTLEMQLAALGAKPKLYEGVKYLTNFEINSSENSLGDKICLLKHYLQDLWERGNQHIVLVTHQPTIATLATAFVIGGGNIPPATHGSILSFYVEKPTDLWDGRCFQYGRTGVCEWTENAPKDAEEQIQKAMKKDYDKLLSVSDIRQQLNNNRSWGQYRGVGVEVE